MIIRKIENTLLKWKQTPNHKPVVVKGIRQCGKTYSVLHFAREHYRNVVYLNFFESPSLATAFEGSLSVDNIVLQLSSLMGRGAHFVPYETCLILDEIQECPLARTALKFFHIDGRYDVISTSSLLGVCGYRDDAGSIPVGYETIVDMYPIDFEEFLWAMDVPMEALDLLRRCLDDETPVPSAMHQRFRQLLLQYVLVGGMPAVVDSFLQQPDLNRVRALQCDIVRSYEDDMVKYAPASDKSLIRECFRSIPQQLAKENKKFQYSLVRKGSTAARFAGCLQWIEDAGIIRRCHNLHITELPLDGNVIRDMFKVYMSDTGLFVSMLEKGAQSDILQGNLFGYKGAIFENLIADIFGKMERPLYYFRKESGLEIDFVMRYRGECVLLEVKATDGNVKSTKTVLAHPEKYHVSHAIKLGDYNVGRNGQVLTLPLYMAFLLREY